MKIIQPSIEVLTPLDGDYILKFLEKCGRVCYRSEGKMLRNENTPAGKEIWQAVDNAAAKCPKYLKDKIENAAGKKRTEKFIRSLIKSGHESVIEHFNITVKVVCSRAISHQIVRHRIGAYSQESQRYVNYKDGIEVIEQPGLSDGYWPETFWVAGMEHSEQYYNDLIRTGVSPEVARDVLPNATATTLIVTYNLRQWRHFLKQRTSLAADPQMRRIAGMILKEFKAQVPVIFEDVTIG